MKKKVVILIACITYWGGMISSSAETDVNRGGLHNHHHALGVSAGSTSGGGGSYRYWPGRSGLQVTMLPIYSPSHPIMSLGVSWLYQIRPNPIASLYLHVGTHAFLYHGKYRSNLNREILYNLGAGPAVDFHISSKISANFMLGFGWYDIGYTINDPSTGYYIFLTGEVGVFYWF